MCHEKAFYLHKKKPSCHVSGLETSTSIGLREDGILDPFQAFTVTWYCWIRQSWVAWPWNHHTHTPASLVGGATLHPGPRLSTAHHEGQNQRDGTFYWQTQQLTLGKNRHFLTVSKVEFPISPGHRGSKQALLWTLLSEILPINHDFLFLHMLASLVWLWLF